MGSPGGCCNRYRFRKIRQYMSATSPWNNQVEHLPYVFDGDACVSHHPTIKKFAASFLRACNTNDEKLPHVRAVVNNNPDSIVGIGYCYIAQAIVATHKASRDAYCVLKHTYTCVKGEWRLPVHDGDWWGDLFLREKIQDPWYRCCALHSNHIRIAKFHLNAFLLQQIF